MTTPERIWAWRWDLPYPSKHQGRREWGDLLMPTEQEVAEYVRTDLHDATEAQLAKAVEALKRIRDCTQPQCGHLAALADTVLAEIEKGESK